MKIESKKNNQLKLGDMLRFWRKHCRISQMDLALDVGVSSRHLSFVETEKSQPSRELVVSIGQALRLPYRQQNMLLVAAGYAPLFKESPLDGDALKFVGQALRRLLKNHNPYPALVINNRYEILLHNSGYEQFICSFLGSKAIQKFDNALTLFYAEDGLKPFVKNWQVVAPMLLSRVKEEAVSLQDKELLTMVTEIADSHFAFFKHEQLNYGLPMLTLELEKDGLLGRFFTTIATIGTPLDLTTQEVRLEMLYPADEATQSLFS